MQGSRAPNYGRKLGSRRLGTGSLGLDEEGLEEAARPTAPLADLDHLASFLPGARSRETPSPLDRTRVYPGRP